MFFERFRRRRILSRAVLPEGAWRRVCADLPLLGVLSPAESGRLRDLAILFLHAKNVSSAAGLVLDEEMRLLIAAQACVPILNLGLDWYDGWEEVIVYPAEFVPLHEYTDEAGVVHASRYPLMGEAWPQGPVILSWEDACRSGAADGINVVIHEMAHKLDMRNGPADGFPPLHREMRVRDWTRAFTEAYEDFQEQVDAGAETAIDPYAAEHPAEFFAVLSEAFFEIPHVLRDCYPDVYAQLAAFYRQDPALRLARDGRRREENE
jgi:Mlc titration factor MtfA (ptsG expression regulator)